MKRILIADDHPLFREALRHVVDRVCPDASYTEASGYTEVLALTEKDETFDLIFIDLMMPGGHDFEELTTLRKRIPLTPTIVVSSREDRPTIRRAMACGVSGYIPKSAPPTDIENAIRSVLGGGIWAPEDVTAPRTVRPMPADTLEDLTPRQYAVLEELAIGRSNREIADDLGIELITVKTHISAILRKLHVKNRLQAVLISRALFGGIPQTREPEP